MTSAAQNSVETMDEKCEDGEQQPIDEYMVFGMNQLSANDTPAERIVPVMHSYNSGMVLYEK